MLAMFGIQRLGVLAEQVGERLDGGFTTGRALINFGFTCCHGFCVGATTGIGALTALCLRQQCINLINDRVTIDVKTNGRISQHQANQCGKNP